MWGQNICFHREIRSIIFEIHMNPQYSVIWSSIKHCSFQVPSMCVMGLRVKKRHDIDVVIGQTDCHTVESPVHSVPV